MYIYTENKKSMAFAMLNYSNKGNPLELTCKVESDALEIHLRHLQHIGAIRQEDIPTLAILRHVLEFALLECLQLGGIVALYPARLVQAQRLPTAFGGVFILQTVLDNLEL